MNFIVENEKQFIEQIYETLADKLKAPFRVGLIGDLGAGKTTLVKGLLHKYGVKESVTSPTFAICKSYSSSSAKFQHIDLYRFSKEADEREVTEYISDAKYITFVEWPEKINYSLKNYDVLIKIRALSENSREVEVIWN